MNTIFHIITVLRRKLQKLIGMKTLGVRVLVINEQGEILLVRHTYTSGWHLPGGGVDARETTKQAALREAYEEAGIKTCDEPTLMGIYYHTVRQADDYVVLYLIHSFVQHEVYSREIAELCWRDRENLPAGTTLSTRRRLQEYFDGISISCHW